MSREERKPLNPMLIYLLRRMCFLLATFFVFTIIIFSLPRMIPGNPLAILLRDILNRMTLQPETIKEIERKLLEQYGLDKPLHIQFTDFVSRIFKGDLGISFYFRIPVAEVIFSRIPWTLMLLVPSTIVSWIIGNFLGAIAAYKRGKATDNILMSIFLTLSQVPYYWLAMILLFIFAVRYEIFPLGGTWDTSRFITPSLTLEFITDYLAHYILPFASIVLSAIGGWAIGMRVMAIYELGSDYVVYSDSLGLKDSKILEYVFKNSILPQITGLALNFGSVVGGQLLTELVFNYRGMGRILYDSINKLDYPLIEGIFIILISTLLIANLIVDFIYAYLDPRVRTGYAEA
ncbi:MAG: ABC transporter permease [Candidatus Brockarchaeota archaeon]|nr:ABC transporter permease [Candidatus Brockarchaeota archaeon]